MAAAIFRCDAVNSTSIDSRSTNTTKAFERGAIQELSLEAAFSFVICTGDSLDFFSLQLGGVFSKAQPTSLVLQ